MVLRAGPYGGGILRTPHGGHLRPWALQKHPWPAQLRPPSPQRSAVEIEIDARTLWTGEPDRDAHPSSADFLDIDHHPNIAFRSREVQLRGDHDYSVEEDLTIRGVNLPCKLRVTYLGQWQTPWWENGVGNTH
jgi:polyisoprenoid-binding protein YceI